MKEVLAYHIIFGCYGFWLPNDPRGSGSDQVRSKPLQKFGKPTKVEIRHSVAHKPHDRERRMAAKQALKYPPVRFTGLQAQSISRGFSEQIATSHFVVWACAIMPDHVHLVIREHQYPVEQVVRLLKQAATRVLLEDERHPFATQRLKSGRLPSVWQQDFRKVFLYSAADIRGRIVYVNNNPLEAGYKPQRWSFVTPFNDI
jgi:REP element-mobilizing transposase RayT